ncbi:MAG: glycosyltransferase family 39 protein [Halobacteriota archaeon]
MGVLAIPMIYAVGRQLFNEETGLVAAFILALSSFNIYYSQEVRMYSLIVLLALTSVYFLSGWESRARNRARLL